MTWAADVHPRLVAIVEGTSTTINSHGLPDAFMHVPTVDEDSVGSSRSFAIQTSGGSTPGPHNHVGGRRATADVQLVVFYRELYNRDELNQIMIADYEQLSAALLVTADWQTTTTGIESIALHGDRDTILDYEIVDTEDRGAMLIIEFPLVYRRTP